MLQKLLPSFSDPLLPINDFQTFKLSHEDPSMLDSCEIYIRLFLLGSPFLKNINNGFKKIKEHRLHTSRKIKHHIQAFCYLESLNFKNNYEMGYTWGVGKDKTGIKT